MRRCVVAGIAVGASALAYSGPAWAGRISVEEDNPGNGCPPSEVPTYVADPGEANNVTLAIHRVVINTLSQGRSCGDINPLAIAFEVKDPAFVTPGGPRCHSIRPALAACLGGPERLWLGFTHVLLGDGSDTLTLEAAAGNSSVTSGAAIDAGTGNDKLTTVNGLSDSVDCGDGDDTVTADVLDSVNSDCEHVTRVGA